MAITFTLNGKSQTLPSDVSPEMPLLWVLRDVLNLTGTKFGCGMAFCGACTVHLNGDAIRPCRDALAGNAGNRRHTGADGIAGQKNGAGSAKRHTPAEFRCRDVKNAARH